MKLIGIAALLVLTGGAAVADELQSPAGHFQLRLRGVGVLPVASANINISGANIGGQTSASDSFVPEADLTYFITDNIAVEAIAAITKHTVRKTIAGTVSNVWLLLPRSPSSTTSIRPVRSGPMSVPV